jgi:TRAP-type C4-dicarboxylate transport system permease small subunit
VNALRALARFMALAGGALFAGVAVLTTVSILGRWLAARPVTGDVELVQVGMAAGIALCLPWCQLAASQLVVDVFTTRAPESTRRGLDRAGRIAAAMVYALLAWRIAAAWQDQVASGESSILLGLPLAWTSAAMLPGLALASVIAAAQAWQGGADEPPASHAAEAPVAAQMPTARDRPGVFRAAPRPVRELR